MQAPRPADRGSSAPARVTLGGLPRPTALIDSLAPEEMTSEVHEFYARVRGGYRMSLFYPADGRAFRARRIERTWPMCGSWRWCLHARSLRCRAPRPPAASPDPQLS